MDDYIEFNFHEFSDNNRDPALNDALQVSMLLDEWLDSIEDLPGHGDIAHWATDEITRSLFEDVPRAVLVEELICREAEEV